MTVPVQCAGVPPVRPGTATQAPAEESRPDRIPLPPDPKLV